MDFSQRCILADFTFSCVRSTSFTNPWLSLLCAERTFLWGLVNVSKSFPFIQAPSGDVHAKPIKKKSTPDSEQVEDEESTYTALKRPGPGEEENDGHLYTHLIEVHTDYVNQNPDKIQDDANYEDVENEASTYTALKRTGEEENDGHLYTHLIEVHKDYVNQNPDKIQDDANYEDVENEESTYTALKRTGEEENDGHLYTHLTEVHTDYVIPKETGF
jgi:hypothetical protein